MKELVFLLEEESAKAMLQSLLPRILDTGIKSRLLAFEGKQDLEKQMVRKMKHYINPLVSG
jgi:predicted transcriptional regulator